MKALTALLVAAALAVLAACNGERSDAAAALRTPAAGLQANVASKPTPRREATVVSNRPLGQKPR